MYHPGSWLEEHGKIKEISASISGIPAEIRTRDLMKTNQKSRHLSRFS
jgi:hypothetical protein